jgi:ABC-2 type transport system ATP-binding protein
MQSKFVDLILEEKKRGATILMSSHIFEEVEKTCDRAVIIKEGKIMEDAQIEKLKHSRKKVYEITFTTKEMATMFLEHTTYKEAEVSDNVITIRISGKVDQLIKSLATYEILDLNVKTQSLEELFMTFYGGKNND